MSLPKYASIRPDNIVLYTDFSELNLIRTGNKSTLKQNFNSVYKDGFKILDKIEKLPFKYHNIRDYTNAYKKLYSSHQDVGKSLKIEIKELGTMSKNQVKSCRKVIECMMSTVLLNYRKSTNYKDKEYISFLTLTLPAGQIHTDKIIRKLQSRFLHNLSRTYGVKYYVWKAEAQKNGNIHFHLLLDRWIAKEKISSLWNAELSTLGYIKRYQDNHNTTNQPPSTKIHSLKGLKNATHYILKYMTKIEKEKRPIIGAIWGASNLAKKLDYPTFHSSQPFFNDVMTLIKKSRLKLTFNDDFVKMYSGKIYKEMKAKTKFLWYEVKKYYKLLSGFTEKIYKDYKQFNEILKLEKEQVKEDVKAFRISPLKPVSILHPQFNFPNFYG